MQFSYQGQHKPSLKTKNKKEALRLALAKDAELVLGQATLPASRNADLEKHIADFIEHIKREFDVIHLHKNEQKRRFLPT